MYHQGFAEGYVERWKNTRFEPACHSSFYKVDRLSRSLLDFAHRGFVRIRSFGFLANRSRTQSLVLCRQLLDVFDFSMRVTLCIVIREVCAPLLTIGRFASIQRANPSLPRLWFT
jgi:hypothetical protein